MPLFNIIIIWYRNHISPTYYLLVLLRYRLHRYHNGPPYCTTWYPLEVGTALLAPVRTRYVLLLVETLQYISFVAKFRSYTLNQKNLFSTLVLFSVLFTNKNIADMIFV